MRKYNEKMEEALEMYTEGLISEIEYLNTVKYLAEEQLSAIEKRVTSEYEAITNGKRADI